MRIKQFEIWNADLSPRFGTETGKTRPVLVVQTDLLNQAEHPSSIICPLTTNVNMDAEILRVHLVEGDANIQSNCDIMIDQIRTIDNRRFKNKIGLLPEALQKSVRENLSIILDL